MNSEHPEQGKTQQGNPRSPRTRHRPSLFGYMVILFLAAFVLLLLSYFMQQRRNDQALIDGLQQNISAMQASQNISEQNKALIAQNNELLETTSSLQEQIEDLNKQVDELSRQMETLTGERNMLSGQLETTRAELESAYTELEQTGRNQQVLLALDWLWRIEREYFKGYYKNARELIQAFEATGLVEFLPDESLVDPEYRTPRYQYQSIYDVLF